MPRATRKGARHRSPRFKGGSRRIARFWYRAVQSTLRSARAHQRGMRFSDWLDEFYCESRQQRAAQKVARKRLKR